MESDDGSYRLHGSIGKGKCATSGRPVVGGDDALRIMALVDDLMTVSPEHESDLHIVSEIVTAVLHQVESN